MCWSLLAHASKHEKSGSDHTQMLIMYNGGQVRFGPRVVRIVYIYILYIYIYYIYIYIYSLYIYIYIYLFLYLSLSIRKVGYIAVDLAFKRSGN